MSTELTTHLNLARSVLTQDTETKRFEQFAAAVVGDIEGGIAIVSTSSSWDMGRDGKSGGRSRIYVCASTTKRVPEKAEHDIRRQTDSKLPPHTIYCCFSDPDSEHTLEQRISSLQSLTPKGCTLQTLNGEQLIEHALRVAGSGGADRIKEHYHAELAAATAFLEDSVEPFDSKAGLRLALATIGHPEAASLRRELLVASLLDVFSRNESQTINEASNRLATAFKLSAPTTHYWQQQLDELVASGLLTRVDSRYSITATGRRKHLELSQSAGLQLLDGQQKIRAQLKEFTGLAIEPDDFAELWKNIEDGLAHAFYTRGQEILFALSQLLATDASSPPEQTLLDIAKQCADSGANSWPTESTKPRIHTAIVDLFTEPSGPAVEWLTAVCSSYVALCTLGFESQSSGALQHAIQRIDLLLDTDVVISLLCEGERNHAELLGATRTWLKLGGRIFVTDPVLVEAAHHAWIATNDYDAARNLLPGTGDDEGRYFWNAFTRTFAYKLRLKRIQPRQWRQFIEAYKGTSATDPSKLTPKLVELGAKHIPAHKTPTTPLGKNAYDALRRSALGNSPKTTEKDIKIAEDKARRDSVLIELLVTLREQSTSRSPPGSASLVSSSGRLRDFPKRLVKAQQTDRYPWVMSPGTWIAMLSLAPGSRLSLRSFKSFLYDDHARLKTRDTTKALLRVIKEATGTDLPFSSRIELEQELRKSAFKTAKQFGVTPTRVDEAVVRTNRTTIDTQLASSAIAGAVGDMLLESKRERQYLAEIAKLKLELDQLKRSKT